MSRPILRRIQRGLPLIYEAHCSDSWSILRPSLDAPTSGLLLVPSNVTGKRKDRTDLRDFAQAVRAI